MIIKLYKVGIMFQTKKAHKTGLLMLLRMQVTGIVFTMVDLSNENYRLHVREAQTTFPSPSHFLPPPLFLISGPHFVHMLIFPTCYIMV